VARQRQLREPPADVVASLRSAVEIAATNLQAAQARLDLLLAGGAPEDQEAADFAVRNAQASLDQAMARRNALLRPSAADVANAQAAVDSAAANVAAAEGRLAEMLAGPRAADLQAAVAAVNQAQSQVALLQQPYTADEIQQQQNAVTQARANLAMRAQPARPEEIAQAAAGVEQARASLDLARDQAADAIVTAPFDGVVAARLMAEGALANPGQPLMTLVTDAVEMMLIVEATRLDQVVEGRPAILTTPSYPGEEFRAVVVAVSPTGDPRSRTFQAKLVPDNPDGKLREGMFAQVRVAGTRRGDAVLVPNRAIVQRAGKPAAFVIADGRAVRHELQLGATEGEYTQVLAGLEPGDQVVTHGQEFLNDGDAVRPSADR
jgi:RND family efflux transporter MFP subunit